MGCSSCLAALLALVALGPALGFVAPCGSALARSARWCDPAARLPLCTSSRSPRGRDCPPLQASAGKRPGPESRPDEGSGSWRSGLRGQLEVARVQVVLWLDRLLDEQMGASAYNTRNRYLLGAWEPVTEENRAVEARVVAGALPPDLRGVFLRIGPNPPVAPTKRHHVFDGEGMIHSVRLHEGKVLYSNSFVETGRIRFERELGEPFFTRIGELYSGWGLAKAILTIPQRQTAGPITSAMEASPVNTAMVLTPSGKFFALNEGGAPFELELDWDGAIKRLVGFETKSGRLDFPLSAHPKVDRATGEIFFHGYSLMSSKAFLRTGRLGADGKVKAWFKVDVPSAGFHHDMALTGKYAVLFDGSARFTPQQMVLNKPVFSWDSNFTTRVALVPRDASDSPDVRWFASPEPFYVIHPLHAWDEGDEGEEVVIWAPLGSQLRGGKVADPDQVIFGADDQMRMSEIRINTRHDTLTVKEIDDTLHSEFCRVREDLVATDKVRYGYAGFMEESDFNFRGCSKWDLWQKRLAACIRYPDNVVGEEPVFIPYGGAGCDDGFLATIWIDQVERWAELVFFDAKTFASEPVARVRLPRRVPHGFHGLWLSEDDMRKHLDASGVAPPD